MKIRNLRTRMTALGLALFMGMSSLGSAPYAFAAETDTDKSKTEAMDVTEATEAAETITEAEGTVSKAGERQVAAGDITKDVSDKDFAVETSMEGIHYDPEMESVTLSKIEGEDGSAYQPDKAGTYLATYLVVPKEQQDAYFITRKVTLTDTEGQAHTEGNGGQKQKEDTETDDDPEADIAEMPEVEVISTDEKDTQEAVEQLEEDIESGNVLLFSGADSSFTARSAVTLEKGETIYYPSYIGNYLTCWFRVNGKIAYCLESHKTSPPSGDYVAQVLDSNKNLQKVLYYGYGGAGDITVMLYHNT